RLRTIGTKLSVHRATNKVFIPSTRKQTKRNIKLLNSHLTCFDMFGNLYVLFVSPSNMNVTRGCTKSHIRIRTRIRLATISVKVRITAKLSSFFRLRLDVFLAKLRDRAEVERIPIWNHLLQLTENIGDVVIKLLEGL